MTQFAFLQREWPMVFAAASKAEGAAQTAGQLQALQQQLHAKDESLAALLADKSALDEELNQIEFVNLIVDHLAEHGIMEPARLYESPFTDVATHGPDALFTPVELDELIKNLSMVKASAVAIAQGGREPRL